MKLSLHEQKILDIIKEYPQVLADPKERDRIAKKYRLSEKTLRNRIAELKKRGIIAQDNSINNLNQPTSIDLDIHSLFKLLFNKKGFIIKSTFFITLIFIIYSLIATPYFESKITVYPAGSLVDFAAVV